MLMQTSTKYNVELDPGEWGIILRVLDEAPHKLVVTIIRSIQAQCLSQQEGAAKAEEE